MKTLKQLFIVWALIAVILTIGAPLTLAEEATAGSSQQGEEKTPAKKAPLFPLASKEVYNDLPAPVAGSAESQFADLVKNVVQNARYILGAIAIAMIVYSGFRMVTGWGNDDVYSKQRLNLLYSIIGLAIVGMAGELSTIFSLDKGGFLKDSNAIVRTTTLFNQQTQIIITFIKYTIGAITVLLIVRNGLRMITMGSSEDKIETDKKNLVYSIIGLVMIVIADNAVRNVFYKLDVTSYPSGGVKPAVDAARGVQEIVGFTNLVVSIVGPVAILALLAGGVMYMTAAGQEDRMTTAKRLILAALAGIIIMYGAFAIVSTFIAGQF